MADCVSIFPLRVPVAPRQQRASRSCAQSSSYVGFLNVVAVTSPIPKAPVAFFNTLSLLTWEERALSLADEILNGLCMYQRDVLLGDEHEDVLERLCGVLDTFNKESRSFLSGSLRDILVEVEARVKVELAKFRMLREEIA